MLKICRFSEKFSPKNCNHVFFVKKIIYNLSLSLKNFIIGVAFLKNNDGREEKVKNKNYRRKIKKSKNFPYLLIQSQFNRTKAKFFPDFLKKNFLLKKFFRNKKRFKIERY